MGRAKQILYNEDGTALRGKELDYTDCTKLDRVIALSDNNGVVSDLKNIIYDIPEFDVDSILEGVDPESLERPLGELRDYQTIGVSFMYMSKYCLLGDSVGIGKTVQVAGLINLLSSVYAREGKQFRYMVLTEKNIVNQFRRELVRFTGEYVEEISGQKKPAMDFVQRYPSFECPSVVGPISTLNQPVIQEYLLAAEKEDAYPFDMLVIDESAVLGNTKTATYKNASAIRKNVDYCIILNATAFESSLEQMYSQIAFVDPSFLPTKTEFQKRYCILKRNPYANYGVPTGQYKNQGEFRSLVRYRYFARSRKSLGAKMEGCSATAHIVPRSPEQRYMLTRTAMPHMVYDNPVEFDNSLVFGAEVAPKAGALRDALLGKLDIEGNWGDARTVLVYCLYVETQEMLADYLRKEGIAVEVMNGDTPMDERKSRISGFKNGDYRVLITNVMKGLNFGMTNHIVVYTTPGNVNRLVQFEGRALREFDIKNKHLLVLMTDGPEEKRFNTILADRAKASDSFAGSDFSLILSLLLK